jgi:hypothetical protein
MRVLAVAVVISFCAVPLWGAEAPTPLVLKPARVFDGASDQIHEGWIVVVRGERIEQAGPEKTSRFQRARGSSSYPA